MFLLLYLVMFILHNLFIDIEGLPSCKISLNNFSTHPPQTKKITIKILKLRFLFFQYCFFETGQVKTSISSAFSSNIGKLY